MRSMISVGIASLPAREKSLERVLDSLTGQVDTMYVCLNGHEYVPEYFEKYNNLSWVQGDNSRGDASKFWWADMVEGYYFSADDDLLYGEGVIAKMLAKCKMYGGNPVSLHGKNYTFPVENYHRDMTDNFRCLGNVGGDHLVDVVGTGCLMFDTAKVTIEMDMFEMPNMADLYFSKACRANNIPLRVIEHTDNWLTYIPQSWTIYANKKREGKETLLINQILSM